MLTKPNPAKTQYSEAEAAQTLGITVDELRALIRRHIVTEDADANNVPMTVFQPSDLLLLRLLANQSMSPAVAG
jgi:hypothetical protein